MVDIKKLVELSNLAVNDYAKEIVTWSFSLLAGSIFIILRTDHIRPAKWYFRAVYLIFPVSWYFLVSCGWIYRHMKGVAFDMNVRDDNSKIQLEDCTKINDLYAQQLHDFYIGIILLSSWVLLYLVWWVFFSDTKRRY